MISFYSPRYNIDLGLLNHGRARQRSAGGLGLSVQQCAERDRLVFERLKRLGVPAVFLTGGGYGHESADALIAGIAACAQVQ